MLSDTEAVCWTVPLVAVIVSFTLLVAALELADIVSVEEAEPAPVTETGFGLNAAVTPLGSGATPRPTLPVKPAAGVILTEYVTDPPRRTLRSDGLTLTEKSPATVMFTGADV